VQLSLGKRPYDLYAVVGYAVAVSALLLVLGEGNYFAILLIFSLPGYVLVAALFPSAKEIHWIERVVLSFSLSVGVVPLLGLSLILTSVGFGFTSIVVGIASFTALFGFVAWWRRSQLPTLERLGAGVTLSFHRRSESALLDRFLAAFLATSAVVAVGTLGYVVLTPVVGERFTEFYLLGSGGNATDYPTRLGPSQPGTVIIGITNHEGVVLKYGVQVDLIGTGIMFNATSGRNERVELNRTTLSSYSATLVDNQNWTDQFTFTIDSVGLWKIQFLLYKDEVLTNHALQIWILVS
jgi:uncharacterized membrane protein